MNKSLYILGALAILGFGALGAIELINAGTPYVTTVAEARSVGNRPVQFMGTILKSRTSYNEPTDELLFALRDPAGESLSVRYKGAKPGGFDTASKAVVRGTLIGGEFIADQVLLKCPSKYEGK